MIDSVSSSSRQTETSLTSANLKRRLRNRLIAIFVLLLIVIVVVPPFINVNRFRRSIVRSISAGLGRPVEASSVELQLLPFPGFVLRNLTVSEDPAFGAEPVLKAESVTAVLRASTLWHRRVEIATLRIHNASVNLVRNDQGRWNFENLLVNSPVLHKRSNVPHNQAISFPYVEATMARINFKRGAEKLPFSLEEADLVLWKQSSHEWRIRIHARPVRTDLSAANAGEIRGSATLISSPTLMNDPVYVRLEWRRVQLGEIDRLLHGEDENWRGTVDWTARGIGTLADVSLSSDINVQEFHRAEFIPATEMDLSAHCSGRYAHDNPKLNSLVCTAPLGSGQFLLRGKFPGSGLADASSTPPAVTKKTKSRRIHSVTFQPDVNLANSTSLQIGLRRVPASFFLNLLSHIHPGVSGDASLSGQINGDANCIWKGLNTLSACTGNIRSTELRLSLPNINKPLVFTPIDLVSSQSENGPEPALWKLSPSHVALGGSSTATLTGNLSSTGMFLTIEGPADLNQLKNLAPSLNVPVFLGAIQHIRGSAKLALSLQTFWISGSYSGPVGGLAPEDLTTKNSLTARPLTEWFGSLDIQNATLRMAALPLDIQLASAQVRFLPDTMQWIGLNGTLAQMQFNGNFLWQLLCPASTPICVHQFSLHTENLNVARLQAAITHADNSPDLLHMIDSWTHTAPSLPAMTGTLNADELTLGKISVKNATLKIAISGHQAKVLSVAGKIFKGNLSGEEVTSPPNPAIPEQAIGFVQWGDGAPKYTLRLNLQHIQPDSVAAIWHEEWGPGTANLKLDLKMQGWSASELAQNTSGKFSITWLNGGLSHADPASTAGSSFEKFQLWDAKGTISDEKISLETSQIIPSTPMLRRVSGSEDLARVQSVKGSINFSRILDLKLRPSGISIQGPINMPVIDLSSNSETTDSSKE